MPKKHPALGRPVRIEYSARHVHLSQADQDALFGAGHTMKPLKELSQTGQFAYEEKVTVRGPKGEFDTRVLGPCRKQTQVELAFSDGRRIGAETPVRVSGDLAGSGGAVTLVGPKGEVALKEGVINDERHLHISDTEAAEIGLKNGDMIDVLVPGDTPIIVRDTVVRVHPSFRMNIHLDTDEANAASLGAQGAMGEIVGVHPGGGASEHFDDHI
jgi:propanediol utilization protein